MKRAILFVMVFASCAVMTTRPIKVRAEGARARIQNCIVLTIPCLPGIEFPELPAPEVPDSVPEVPDSIPEVPDSVPEEEQSMHAYVLRIVELVNEERTKAGLDPVALRQDVTQAAYVRAREIEKSFSHTRPNGSNFSTALKEAGVSYRTAGENIAWGQRTPEEVMQGWMNSAGHRANILNPNYTSIGVGYHQSAAGVNYWSQLFVS